MENEVEQMVRMFLKIGPDKYRFQRFITEREYELFKTHIGAGAYHFKKCSGNRLYAFYVRNTTGQN